LIAEIHLEAGIQIVTPKFRLWPDFPIRTWVGVRLCSLDTSVPFLGEEGRRFFKYLLFHPQRLVFLTQLADLFLFRTQVAFSEKGCI
jgi:hypothetical protein